MQSTEKIIRQYLPQIIHMALTTSVNGKPWVCQVHFAWDNELNIYFCSSVNSRHCREIEQNPNVAGNITTQHFLNQKTRCVSFEGRAERLESIDETHPGFVAYTQRLGEGPHFVKAAKGEGAARFYKITVADFYVADGYESTPPQKLHLSWQNDNTL